MFVVPVGYSFQRRPLNTSWVQRVARPAAVPAAAALRPAMDATESDQAYTLTFDLPGMTREQVQVALEGREVRVDAAATETPLNDGAQVLRRERLAPRFARRVTLDTDIDVAASSARFENGVLTLTLVKQPALGVQRIEVR